MWCTIFLLYMQYFKCYVANFKTPFIYSIVDVFDSTCNIVAKECSKSDIVDFGSDFIVDN